MDRLRVDLKQVNESLISQYKKETHSEEIIKGLQAEINKYKIDLKQVNESLTLIQSQYKEVSKKIETTKEVNLKK